MPACAGSSPAARAISGYTTIAIVDSALTPMIVKLSALSRCGCGGIAAASAIAAEAPQIAVAPPESTPKAVRKPISRAATIEMPIVSATEATTPSTGCQPSAAISPPVMRSPSSATPQRSTVRALKATPGAHWPSDRKFIAMPSSSANSITGAP